MPAGEPRGTVCRPRCVRRSRHATWREFGYLLLSLPISIVAFVFAVTMLSLGAGLLITFLGVPVLAAALAGCRGFGATGAGPGARPARSRRGGTRGRAAGRTPACWPGWARCSGAAPPGGTLLYALVHFPWAVFAFSVSMAFWSYGWAMLTYPLWQWVFPMYAGTRRHPALRRRDAHHVYLDNPFEITIDRGCRPADHAGHAVDRPGPGIGGPAAGAAGCSARRGWPRRVVELESDRGVVVDTAAADLRRIERDLHDGAQARLVALAMDLGLAKEKLTEDPQAAARMVDEAHGEVKIALQELRDLARGIHPAVLTDRGLDAALSAVAARCTVPVQVEVDLPARPAPRHRGHRLLHGLRAAAEHQQAQPGDQAPRSTSGGPRTG